MPDFDANVQNAQYREKPHSIEAEQSVLGGLYIDNTLIPSVADILPDGKAFYNKTYGAIYEAMLYLHSKGMAIDPLTVQERLKEMDVPPEVVNPEFLRDIVLSVPTAVNTKDYATDVAEKAVLRDLIRVSEHLKLTSVREKVYTSPLTQRQKTVSAGSTNDFSTEGEKKHIPSGSQQFRGGHRPEHAACCRKSVRERFRRLSDHSGQYRRRSLGCPEYRRFQEPRHSLRNRLRRRVSHHSDH